MPSPKSTVPEPLSEPITVGVFTSSIAPEATSTDVLPEIALPPLIEQCQSAIADSRGTLISIFGIKNCSPLPSFSNELLAPSIAVPKVI